jgi:hypothetical protein
MGLTIFYSCKVRDLRLLPALTEQVMDICDHLHWKSGNLKLHTHGIEDILKALK